MGRNKQFSMSEAAHKSWATRRLRRGEQIVQLKTVDTEGLSPAQKAWQTRRGGKPAFPRRRPTKPSFKVVGDLNKWFAVVKGTSGHWILEGKPQPRTLLGYVVADNINEAQKLSKKHFGIGIDTIDVNRRSNNQPGAFNLNYERIGSLNRRV